MAILYGIDVSKGLAGIRAVTPTFMRLFAFLVAGVLVAIFLIDGEVSFSDVVLIAKGFGAWLAVALAAVFLIHGIRAS
jgi:hypothetical protein